MLDIKAYDYDDNELAKDLCVTVNFDDGGNGFVYYRNWASEWRQSKTPRVGWYSIQIEGSNPEFKYKTNVHVPKFHITAESFITFVNFVINKATNEYKAIEGNKKLVNYISSEFIKDKRIPWKQN